MSLKVEAAVWGLMRDPCFTKRSRNVYFRSVTLRGSGLAASVGLGGYEVPGGSGAPLDPVALEIFLHPAKVNMIDNNDSNIQQ